ncbi:MAG: VWA domain-containing protein [Armatimonadetes bacterium]|nr:VWA domain-containing protein [Armatimonadota bacterium]
MSLANPLALMWLIPCGGVIIALYLLKMRRRDVFVPASFLWPSMTEEVRANSLFQKLRPNLLLFLQLLALLLMAVALARPQVKQSGLAGEVTVFVVDTSASMSATDVKPSRLGEAKRLVQESIKSARASDRIAVIEAGPVPKVITPLSSDSVRQLAGLDELEPSDAECNIGEALRLAAALVGTIDGARIVLLSDGDFPPIDNFARGKAAFVYQCIGSSSENLAISAFGASETSRGKQLYCAVKNYGFSKAGGSLNIYADGNLIDSVKTGEIGPSGTWGRTMPIPASATVLEAKLTADDYLASDNYAALVTDPGASLHVLLVTRGDLFLERALALDPRVTLDKASRLPESTSGYDVVVFDGVPEQPTNARGVLTFGTPGDESPVASHGVGNKPTFVSSEHSPLMEGVDFAPVYIEHQAKVEPKPDAQVLSQTSTGPLVVTRQFGAKRSVFVAFEPQQSDFPLQVGFPIFIANALDFLAGSQAGNVLAVKPGQTFSLPSTVDAQLTDPSGRKMSIQSNGASVVVRGLTKVGRYVLDAGGKRKVIYASLTSDWDSNIAPVKDLRIAGGDIKATASPSTFADFWRPLMALCLLVLAAEWWVFVRRS